MRTLTASVFSRTSMPSRAKASDRICAASRSSLGRNSRQVLRDDGLRSEAAERLRQLAAERAAADHQQAARQLGQVEDVLVGQIARLDEAGNRRRVRPRAGGDHGLLEAQLRAVHRQRVGSGEARLAEEHVDAGRAQALRRIDAADAGADAGACAASRRESRRGCRRGSARHSARHCASRRTAARCG